MAKYLCKNFAACSKADSREEIDLPAGAETKCPECGAELHPAASSAGGGTPKSKAPVVAAVAALVLAVGGGGFWFLSSKEAPVDVVASSSPPPNAGVAPDDAKLQQDRRGVDGHITAGAPAAVTADAQRRVIAQEYVKAAIPLMQAGDWAAADAQLERAREANPDEPLVYINQAIVQLKQARRQEALQLLEMAFDKGFRDFKALETEADLKRFTAEPSYRALVARYQAN